MAMSVMMASADTMAKVAELIYRVVHWGYEQERFSFSSESAVYIKSIWGDIDGDREQRIYEALRELSRNSYNARYKESGVAPFVDCPYEYSSFKRSENWHMAENGPEDYQKLKSVQFLKYQCDEHDNSPNAIQMFKALEEIEHHLTRNIVENSPEWKAAKWA
jgi:hypothetical protein